MQNTNQGGITFLPTAGNHQRNEINEAILASFAQQLEAVRHAAQIADEDVESAANWLGDLKCQSLQSIAEKQGSWYEKVRIEATLRQAVASLVDTLYARFMAFSGAFNDELGGTDFEIFWTRPTYVTEVLSYNILREAEETVNNFRCRFSTRYWSMVIRGQGNCVEIFFVPTSKVLGMTKTEKQAERAIKINATLSNDKIYWDIEGKELTPFLLEVESVALFQRLVEKTDHCFQDNKPHIA